MKFSDLAVFFQKIEKTSSRVEMTKILAELFQKLKEDEIDKTAYLLQGRVCPLFEKIEFGIAERMVIKAATRALQIDVDNFNREFKRSGDVGETVEKFKKEITSFDANDLTITEVYNDLYRLATSQGNGSQDLKINILSSLIRQLDPLSTRYVVRIPLSVLRLGFSDMTILDAYSWMITGDKSLRPEAQNAYQVRPDLGYIGRVLKEKGIKGLKKVEPKVFTPILMMRAERLSSGQEILDKIGRCAIEAKYDGFRLQVHYKRKTGEVRLYTRGLEDSSVMYPDIAEGVLKEIDAEEAIFEGEAIGFDPVSGNFLPFQETVQRKRKYDVAEKAKEIPLKLFAFDLLYCNGNSFIHSPFSERRKELARIIKNKTTKTEDTIIIAPEEIMDDAKNIELFFDDAVTKGLEGIVAKKLDGTYQPGARGWNWIKFKRSYSSKIEDTIDCLVLGYDKGKGKRASFGIGAFLVGVYNAKDDTFVTVAKIGTGLTDEEWKELKKKSEKLVVNDKPKNYDVDKMMDCDVWLKESIVVEIKADEITRSPVHTAGRVLRSTKSGNAMEVEIAGFALRFPRLERFRTDKLPEDVTSVKEVETMFKKQGKK